MNIFVILIVFLVVFICALLWCVRPVNEEHKERNVIRGVRNINDSEKIGEQFEKLSQKFPNGVNLNFSGYSNHE